MRPRVHQKWVGRSDRPESHVGVRVGLRWVGRSDVSDSKTLAALRTADGRSVGLLRLKFFAALRTASGSVGRVKSRSFPCLVAPPPLARHCPTLHSHRTESLHGGGVRCPRWSIRRLSEHHTVSCDVCAKTARSGVEPGSKRSTRKQVSAVTTILSRVRESLRCSLLQ